MKTGRQRGNWGLARLWLLAAAVLGAAILSPRGAAAYSEQVLYSFCPQSGCVDGAFPQAGLIMDAAGNLYGTTQSGGTAARGVVFELASDGTETILYRFCSQSGCADGQDPEAGVIMAAAGNLYGTTQYGGTSSGGLTIGGGVVFELTP